MASLSKVRYEVQYPNPLPAFTTMYKGVAFIVSNDYKDSKHLKSESRRLHTHEDAEKMERFFKDLKNYIVITTRNLSKKEFINSCNYLVNEFPKDYTRIVVYFAGHGKEDGILMQNGKDKVNIKDDLIPNFRKMNNVVRIFFIDACRGDKIDEGVRTRGNGSNGNGSNENGSNAKQFLPIPSVGKILVAYATMEGYVSHELLDGGVWTSELYKELMKSKDKSIHAVLSAVYENLREVQITSTRSQSGFAIQSSEISGILTGIDDVKFWYEAGNVHNYVVRLHVVCLYVASQINFNTVFDEFKVKH